MVFLFLDISSMRQQYVALGFITKKMLNMIKHRCIIHVKDENLIISKKRGVRDS